MIRYILPVMAITMWASACSNSTHITSSWNNPDSAAVRPLQKVMIVALLPDRDRDLRQRIEQEVATKLAMEGFVTVSAFTQFGPQAFEGKKEKEVLESFAKAGVDGVMTISLLDKEKEKNYVPGKVTYYPGPTRYNRFWGYYRTYARRVHSPGYYTTSTRYFLETNLYDTQRSVLLYSSQSEAVDPGSVENLAGDYAKALVNDMKDKKLLAGKP